MNKRLCECIKGIPELRGYKDSSEKYIDSQYSYAVQLFTEGDYKTAADIFKTLGNYKDTTDKLKESIYLQASSLYGDEKYADAMVMLEEIKDYKDANNLLEDCKYQQSVDAQFIRALAKGLMERWDLNVDNSSMSATEIKENYKKCVNAELNSIGEFADKNLKTKGLKKYGPLY